MKPKDASIDNEREPCWVYNPIYEKPVTAADDKPPYESVDTRRRSSAWSSVLTFVTTTATYVFRV
jgi:hypothetical protein